MIRFVGDCDGGAFLFGKHKKHSICKLLDVIVVCSVFIVSNCTTSSSHCNVADFFKVEALKWKQLAVLFSLHEFHVLSLAKEGKRYRINWMD